MKKTICGLLSLILIGIIAAGNASAFGWWQNKEEMDPIREALEAGDYSGWKDTITEMLTEENFEKARERYEEKEEKRENRDAIREAVDADDYDAYLEAVDGLDAEMILDEEDFDTLVKIHEAREEGDFETVDELRDDLDFPMQGIGRRMGSRMKSW